LGLDFVAVDFETASYKRSSACAVGLAFVRDGKVAELERYYIRPPSKRFDNSRIHGLTWDDVRNAPDFEELWYQLRRQLKAEVLVAHNAAFDKGVLSECLRHYDIRYKMNPFLCSGRLSKEAFDFDRWSLRYICKRLKIPLKHHESQSDANASARIAIKAARKLGIRNAKKLLQVCGD
jgi:DNA polymerase-3 subunit epsilon